MPYSTAYRSLFQIAHAKPGETVLIHGASGGVGVAAIQWATTSGLRVLGTAGSEHGLQLIKEQGADLVFNHQEEAYRQQVVDATGGAGANIIIEMLANVNLGHDLKLLAHRGRVVVIGSRGDVQITPRDIMMREATIMAVFLWGAPPEDIAEINAALQSCLRSGALKPVVGRELPLASASQAHRRIMEPGALAKIVLTS